MSKKVIIIAAAASLLVIGLIGGMFYMLWHKMSNIAAAVPANGAHPPVAHEAKKETPGPIYPLETFIVNLADRGKDRYLRVTIQLQLEKPTLKEEMDQRLPQVRDRILTIVPTKTYETVTALEGKAVLRDELLKSLNEVLQSGKITNLYFTEFVVQ